MTEPQKITIIGGGLAGCEAAWQAARRNCRVALFEMKPQVFSPAHSSPLLAELVCSNSLRSNDIDLGRRSVEGGDAPPRFSAHAGGRRHRGPGRQGPGRRP